MSLDEHKSITRNGAASIVVVVCECHLFFLWRFSCIGHGRVQSERFRNLWGSSKADPFLLTRLPNATAAMPNAAVPSTRTNGIEWRWNSEGYQRISTQQRVLVRDNLASKAIRVRQVGYPPRKSSSTREYRHDHLRSFQVNAQQYHNICTDCVRW